MTPENSLYNEPANYHPLWGVISSAQVVEKRAHGSSTHALRTGDALYPSVRTESTRAHRDPPDLIKLI